MDTNNIIKSIFPQVCPHCKKDIMIGVQTVSPIISEIMTEDDVKEAKKKVRDAATLQLKGDELQQAIVWIDDENTVFGLRDVDAIIANFKK